MDDKLEKLRKAYEEDRPNYEQFAEGLGVLIAQLCREGNVDVESFSARAKDTKSVVKKIQRKEYSNLDQVTDKAGVRVVTRYLHDVQKVVDILNDQFDVIEHVKHGNDQGLTFGYSSDHILLQVSDPRLSLPEWRRARGLVAEVQVRSILQHSWATISHSLVYKNEVDLPPAALRNLSKVAALLELTDDQFDGFRHEVLEARASYREQIERAQWRKLPLDLDSLSEAWTSLPNQALAEAANRVGYGLPLEPEEMTPATSSLQRLIGVAHEHGYKELGDIADAIVQASRDQDFLEGLRESLTTHGVALSMTTADMVTLYLFAEMAEPSRERHLGAGHHALALIKRIRSTENA
ncbi:GTP diphosphokinase [Micromonospora saelicesensis]|uniref:GTP diphosphokinase n=1 Tax=Micromonospora saelicesensis TaxID=285676 RepID=A0A328NJJ5_9ACTN|nr:hypothetical protein [Micromonospora saelicesensis]RAO27938.1 GTP diphosphokinase [Micromonospora saelicesensis]